MLIFLLIYILLSNALTTRCDKSILFSRIVIKSLIMISFLAYNNIYLSPLAEGVGIYGGLFNVTTFTQTFSIFLSLVSAVILTLTSLYPKKVYIDKLFIITIGLSLSSSIKLPLLFFTKKLEIPLVYIFIAAFISIIVVTTLSLLSNKGFLRFIQGFTVFILALTFGVVGYIFRQYDILGCISILLGDLLPLGMCLMTDGTNRIGSSTPGTGSITLNSNQNSSTGNNNVPALGNNSGPANNNTPVSASGNPTTLNDSFTWNNRNIRQMSEAELFEISTGEWRSRQNERIREARELKRKVTMNKASVKDLTERGISIPQCVLDDNKRDADRYKDLKKRIHNAQKRLDDLNNL